MSTMGLQKKGSKFIYLAEYNNNAKLFAQNNLTKHPQKIL